MSYARGKQGIRYVEVPLEGGARAIRSTGTPDPDVADALEAAFALLRTRQQWRELRAVADGVLTFTQVRDAWAGERLATVGAILDDADLAPHVAQWHQELVLKFGDGPRPGVQANRTTPAHYLAEVRRVIPEGQPFRRSAFTAAALTAHLAARPGSPATKARTKAALSSFAASCVRATLLPTNPLRDVPQPKVTVPEPTYLDQHDARRLVADLGRRGDADAHRAMSALGHASGMELQALRHLRVEYLDPKRQRARARGTKRPWRDRWVDVEAWAWPLVQAHLAALAAALGRPLRPSDLVFPALAERRGAQRFQRAHRAAVRRLGLDPAYGVHDARHTYAVRYIAAGVPAEYVAGQLGHKDTEQVNATYGRFRPSTADAARYQAMAAARDAERAAEVEAAAEPANVHTVPGDLWPAEHNSRNTTAVAVANS